MDNTPTTGHALSSSEHGQKATAAWFFSLILHSGFLYFVSRFATTRPSPGDASADFRTVGIYSRNADRSDQNADRDSTPTSGDQELQPDNSHQDAAEPDALEIAPPISLDLPTQTQALIGPGINENNRRTPAPNTPQESGVVRNRNGGSPSRGVGDGNPGEGRVAFFGSEQPGTRFVFLVDVSASMSQHNAIKVAKAELIASLEQVTEEQEFQIVFYNERVLPMPAKGLRTSMLSGGEISRKLAQQHVRGTQPTGGTHHKEALIEGLKFKPDVIFFLTDAGEPWMTASDLAEIKKRNSGRARICVVEFGKGNQLSTHDAYWTRRLAKDNAGTYNYHNILEFNTQP